MSQKCCSHQRFKGTSVSRAPAFQGYQCRSGAPEIQIPVRQEKLSNCLLYEDCWSHASTAYVMLCSESVPPRRPRTLMGLWVAESLAVLG